MVLFLPSLTEKFFLLSGVSILQTLYPSEIGCHVSKFKEFVIEMRLTKKSDRELTFKIGLTVTDTQLIVESGSLPTCLQGEAAFANTTLHELATGERVCVDCWISE